MIKQRDLLKELIWITLLTITGQIIFLVAFQLALGGSVTVALGEGVLWRVLLYPIVIKAISFFLVVQAISYGVLITLVMFCASQLRQYFPWFEKRLLWMTTLLWLFAFGTCFLGNIIYYPNSFYAAWLTKRPDFFSHSALNILILWSCLILFWSALISLCVTHFVCHTPHKKRIFYIISLFALLLGMKEAWAFFQTQSNNQSLIPFEKPNIVIIGLDALRPDHIGFNNPKSTLTPYLDRFLKNAVIFDDTLTPLARTFPAWVSILTSAYPKYHGARFNLDAPSFLNISFTLPKELQRNGYETWFATDETRFSNIDSHFGFDHLVKPPEGVNDFLLGTLNDFPISNLVVNSWLGEKLFPYSYANRAAYVTYRPETFVKKLDTLLPNQTQLKKPLFLSMHLLLTHWPNEWANSRFTPKSLLTDRYDGSVQAIDTQWGDIMAVLEKKKLLENAIIIVLSDHGESLGMPGDRLLQEKKHMPGRDSIKEVERARYVMAPQNSFRFNQDYGIDTTYGHGTDVLSMSQYQTLLAWQWRGKASWIPHRVEARASLLDIAPTLLDILRIPSPKRMDGSSLLHSLLQEKEKGTENDIYLEDGFKIPAIKSDHISVRDVLEQSLHAYNISDQTGKITMKPDIEQRGIHGKEYAIVSGHWILAYYPPYQEDPFLEAILKLKKKKIVSAPRWYIVDLKTKQWSGDLNSTWARHTPAVALQHKLKLFFELASS